MGAMDYCYSQVSNLFAMQSIGEGIACADGVEFKLMKATNPLGPVSIAKELVQWDPLIPLLHALINLLCVQVIIALKPIFYLRRRIL